MIRRYRWQPDTCGCAINEVHNTDTDEWSAEETFTNPRGEVFNTTRCPTHSSIADPEELYGVILKYPDGENRRKNVLEGKLKAHPLLGRKAAAGHMEFLDGVSFKWEFSGHGKSRVLTVSVVGADLTLEHKRELVTACEAEFGVGKVVVK